MRVMAFLLQDVCRSWCSLHDASDVKYRGCRRKVVAKLCARALLHLANEDLLEAVQECNDLCEANS